MLFYNFGINPANAKPVEEVVEVIEITQNARLVALDIRIRIAGELKLVREKGSPNRLLALEDKLGYVG